MKRLGRVSGIAIILILLTTSMGMAGETAFSVENLSPEKADVKLMKSELMIARSERLAAKQLKVLIKKHKGTPLESALWFRLAELYIRQSKTEQFFELHRDSSHIVRLLPSRVKNASAKGKMLKAIDTYDHLQRRFPRFAHMDLVLFNSAFARQQVGDFKGAETHYWRLVRDFSQSALVADAHLAIGEISFQQSRFSHALEHFKAIKKYPNSRVYPYGLYKTAWTYYNLHQTRQALDELEAVVKVSHQQRFKSRFDLRSEALKDMVLFFADVKSPDEAFAYFSEQAGELERSDYLLRLADLYRTHSKHASAVEVLSTMLKADPTSESSAEASEKIVLIREDQRDRSRAVQELKAFASRCEKFNAQQTLSKECFTRLEKVSGEMARKWMRLWKNNKKTKVFDEPVRVAFQIYLDLKPQGNNARLSEYAYADFLFQQKDFTIASQHFLAVADQIEDQKIRHDALYAAIFSYEQSQNEILGKSPDKSSDKSSQQHFVTLVQRYIEQYPKGTHVLDLKFRMALMAYEAKNYAVAGPLFLDLGKAHGNTDKGIKAQDLYLDILNIKKDYAGLVSYSNDLLKNKGLSAKRSGQLSKILQESTFFKVQEDEKKQQYAIAIEGYKKFANEFPKSPLASKAIFNAVHLLYKEGREFEAATLGVQYAREHSNQVDAKDLLMRSAQSFEEMAQLTRAAESLLLLSKLEKSTEQGTIDRWKALAMELYWLDRTQNKSNAKVASDLAQQLMQSQDGDIRTRARNVMADIIVSDQPLKKASADQLQKVAQLGSTRLSYEAEMSLIEQQFGKSTNASLFSRSAKIVGSRAENDIKARARWTQAQILIQEFKQQSLKSQVDRVHLVLALKTEKMQKAQQALESVIRYGHSEHSVKSLTALANLYASYVQEIKDMPIPKGLSTEEAKAFRAELDRLVMPIEERSVETLMQAQTEAIRLHRYDGTVKSLTEQVNRRNFQGSTIDFEMTTPERMLPQRQKVGS